MSFVYDSEAAGHEGAGRLTFTPCPLHSDPVLCLVYTIILTQKPTSCSLCSFCGHIISFHEFQTPGFDTLLLKLD
jgi:hypothetical protein